jgi:hypothetical protein
MQNLENNWTLKNISISKQQYGVERGSYKGEIEFESGIGNKMSMIIPPERCAAYMQLLAEDIISSAHEIGHRVANSIIPPSLPPATEINIETQS